MCGEGLTEWRRRLGCRHGTRCRNRHEAPAVQECTLCGVVCDGPLQLGAMCTRHNASLCVCVCWGGEGAAAGAASAGAAAGAAAAAGASAGAAGAAETAAAATAATAAAATDALLRVHACVGLRVLGFVCSERAAERAAISPQSSRSRSFRLCFFFCGALRHLHVATARNLPTHPRSIHAAPPRRAGRCPYHLCGVQSNTLRGKPIAPSTKSKPNERGRQKLLCVDDCHTRAMLGRAHIERCMLRRFSHWPLCSNSLSLTTTQTNQSCRIATAPAVPPCLIVPCAASLRSPMTVCVTPPGRLHSTAPPSQRPGQARHGRRRDCHVLLRLPLPSAGVSIVTERGCHQNDSLTDGQAGRPPRSNATRRRRPPPPRGGSGPGPAVGAARRCRPGWRRAVEMAVEAARERYEVITAVLLEYSPCCGVRGRERYERCGSCRRPSLSQRALRATKQSVRCVARTVCDCFVPVPSWSQWPVCVREPCGGGPGA